MGDPAELSRRKPRGPKERRTIDGCGCVAPVGFVLFFGGLLAFVAPDWFRVEAERAVARVVESVQRPGYRPFSRASYYVTFEFQTSRGVVERAGSKASAGERAR
jgi:hypothetical protein